MSAVRVEAPARFAELIAAVTGPISGLAIEPGLTERLDALFPAAGPLFNELEGMCRQGIAEGWLCGREAGGIRFGRVLKATPETHGFSVDVVEMNDIAGPHHRHPGGEIDMVMPIDPDARFDGTPRGWMVYGPASAHRPTVTGGKAVILYLLPQGAIEFTGE
jgi:hypothetical protein